MRSKCSAGPLTVIYPGEGHALRDPDHLADVDARTLAWFDRYLKP